MTDIFLKIAGMSMTACAVIMVVLLLRLGARRVSKGLTYFLWAAVFFRLLCPFTLTLPHAIVTPVTVESVETDVELYNSAPATNIADRRGTNIVLYTTETADIPAYKSMDNLIKTGTFIWLLGFFAVSFFGVSGFVKLKKRLKSAVQCGGYYICTDIDNPFILGIIKPKIYLPEGLTERERELILLHENAHIRLGDHIAKIIMYAALCIHWFNPLVWISFRLCERDMEIYCDSRVTEKMDGKSRADYSQALLNISAGKTAAFTACFGESSAKSRIKSILSYKKPALWIIIVCTILIGAVSAVLLVDRKDKLDSVFYNTYPCNGMTISCGGMEAEYWLYENGEYRDAPKTFLDKIYAADITQIAAPRIKEGSTDVSFDFMGLYDYHIVSGEDKSGRMCYEIHTYQVKTGYAAYFSIPEKDYNILLANAERLVNYTVEPPDYDTTIIMDTINGARDNVNITNHDKQYNAVEPQVTEQLFETLGQCNFVPIKLDIANMMASSLMEKINIDCTAEIISQGRSLSLFKAVNDDSRCVFGVFVLDGGNIYAYELTVPEYVKIDNEFYYISNYYYDLKHNKPVETDAQMEITTTARAASETEVTFPTEQVYPEDNIFDAALLEDKSIGEFVIRKYNTASQVFFTEDKTPQAACDFADIFGALKLSGGRNYSKLGEDKNSFLVITAGSIVQYELSSDGQNAEIYVWNTVEGSSAYYDIPAEDFNALAALAEELIAYKVPANYTDESIQNIVDADYAAVGVNNDMGITDMQLTQEAQDKLMELLRGCKYEPLPLDFQITTAKTSLYLYPNSFPDGAYIALSLCYGFRNHSAESHYAIAILSTDVEYIYAIDRDTYEDIRDLTYAGENYVYD